MTPQIGIVLAVFIAFVALILSGKVKIHVAALMIPIVLEISGVLSFKDAWAGLTNSSVIMMASMFVVGSAIGKTSLLSRMSKALIKPGSSDVKIMLGIAVPILFLGCFTNATATMVIMIPMITGICAEQKRPLSKFMYPAAVLAQVAAAFIKVVAQIPGGAVAVVRKGLHDNGHAAGAVSLVYDLLVGVLVVASRCLLDAAVDVVVGHIAGLGLGDAVPKLAVGCRVGAALLYRHGDLPGHLGEYLGPGRVGSALFPLDVVPFGMSRHTRYILSYNCRPLPQKCPAWTTGQCISSNSSA